MWTENYKKWYEFVAATCEIVSVNYLLLNFFSQATFYKKFI